MLRLQRHGEGRSDLAGANRPTQVKGVLVEEERTSSLDTFATWKVDRSTGSVLNPEPRTEVVEGGRVRFVGKETQEVETGAHGLITVTLPPGTYEVTANKEGYAEMHGQVMIQPLTAPIWQEEANLIQEPENPDHARGLYGIELLVTLGKPNGVPGRVVRSMESGP